MLRFIHLSDIHFSGQVPGIGFDPDEDVRNELKIDLEHQTEKLGAAQAILVTGDVAYGGKKTEYEDAQKWLNELCDTAKCDRLEVYVCPGNHDVDQDVFRSNSMILDTHDAIRRFESHFDREAALMKRLQQPVGKNELYAAMAEFNDFAARYECSFFADAESYAWDHDFELNDGSTLRIRGMNSALLSGLSDAEGTLYLGARAYTMPRRSGVEYLSMSHHPPSWLLDGKEAGTAIEDRARIQLFGHEHDQRVVPALEFVKVFAGAVNPHRKEPNWRPGYNIIEVAVRTEGVSRFLDVCIYAREWRGKPPRFHAVEDKHGNLVHRSSIPLPAWAPSRESSRPEKDVTEEQSAPTVEVRQEEAMIPIREIVNRFFRLPLSQKAEVVGRMNLASDADRGLPDVERYKRALVRAKESNRLVELEKLIKEMEAK